MNYATQSPYYYQSGQSMMKQRPQQVILEDQKSAQEDLLAYQASEDALDNYVCGCVSPLLAGYLVCVLTLVEGVLVSFELLGITDLHLFQGLGKENPFGKAQVVSLWILCMVDIVFSIFVGALGMYLCTNALPAWVMNLANIREVHADICNLLVKLFASWRALVTFLIAPWVGVMLAFVPSAYTYDKGVFMAWTACYIALNICSLWTLMAVQRVAVYASLGIQNAINLWAKQQRQQYVEQAYAAGIDSVSLTSAMFPHNVLFGCLPVEPTVYAYLLALCIACALWAVEGKTAAGWAFLLEHPEVRVTRVLERAVYVWGSAISFSGLIGLLAFRQSRDELDLALESEFSYSEDVERMQRSKRRSLTIVLVCFMGNLLRVCLFVPITGMVLLSKNVCGFYVSFLSGLALENINSGVAVHCSEQDWWTFAPVAAIAAVDGYLAWGVFKLWRSYRTQQHHLMTGGKAHSYGSAYNFGSGYMHASAAGDGPMFKDAVL